MYAIRVNQITEASRVSSRTQPVRSDSNPIGLLLEYIMKNEKWLPVDGYNGMYEVSDKGSVRSLHRANSPHILAQHTDDIGRKSVALWKNGSEKRIRVHRLVLTAFIGLCPDRLETCHNDGNASNNNLSNLRWDTHISNCQDRKKHGKENGCFKKGMRMGAKVSMADVKKIREIGRSQTLQSIASAYPIGDTQISNILLGYNWNFG